MKLKFFELREKGLPEMIELISDALNTKIEQLQEEKAEELSRNMLEKIPECPVNINLCFKKCTPINVLFVIVRFVLRSLRRINRSSAA